MDPNRRHNLYRPQIPADPLRGNPCDSRDPRSHVQPLKGLRETLTASVSYRASVPAGHAYCEVAPFHRALAPAADRQNGSFKALSGKGSAPAPPPPFRHTPFRPRPRHTAPVWRNPGQHPQRDGTFTFSAKERDSETGLSYFGSRYYSSDLSIWLSVDPMSDKYAYQSGYIYCGNNPIKIIDPNGMWEWDASGNLVAQSKDNSYTLAAFLGTSPKNAMTILSRSGVTADNNGILNLKSGQVLSKHTLYIDHGSGDFPTVNDNMEAIAHYYSGNGKPASVGFLAALAILNSDKFRSKHNKITTMGTASPEGYFSVDLTSIAQFFHIGKTGVDYSITGNGKTSAVTYTLFTNTDKNSPNKTDGFWDPNFIIEKTMGKVFNRFSSDEKGNKLELGGTPYPYAVRKITFFYKPVEE